MQSTDVEVQVTTLASEATGELSAMVRRHAVLSRLSVVIAFVYVALLPLNIPLHGPLYVHDLLAPVLAALVVLRARAWRFLRPPDSLLALFLLIAALTTVVHFGGMKDLKEWCIFGYMGVLYVFFSSCRLPARGRYWLGLCMLTACVVFLLVQRATGVQTSYEVYEGSTLGFMARRFFFTFPHPNLTGSFYVLPVVLVLSALLSRSRGFSRRQWVMCCAAACVLLVPLVLTVSRHMLLTGAVGLGFLVALSGRKRWAWCCAAACLAVVFVLFYLTILFPFFPLQSRFPFFNCDTYGMYMIHQVIYLKIIVLGLPEFLLGVGKSGVAALYPQLADWDTTYKVLAQYRQEFLTESFVTYMDAHNEYLNTGTGFVACCMGFWATVCRGRRRASLWPVLVFFVAGVLLACLWDDLLSKRWIWVTLGVLTACTGGVRSDPDAGQRIQEC
jgi:hypothetical protein